MVIGPGGAGGGAPVTLPPQPLPSGCGPSATRIWKLTPDQLTRTIEALLPGATKVADELTATLTVIEGDFTNRAGALDMSEPHVSQLFRAARTLAARVVEQRGMVHPCLGTATGDRACVKGFVEGFGARAFRRPLAASEVEVFMRSWDAEVAARGSDKALRQVATRLFLHPAFLYRTELGAEGAAGPVVALTPHERASALSYFLTDGPPDAMLVAAADRNQLGDAAQLAAQARRLLATAAGARGVRKLFGESFHHGRVLQADKDEKVFPTFTPALVADMVTETEIFVQEVLWKGDGRLSTLLTADFSMVNGRLAPIYGLKNIAASAGFAKVTLPAGTRAGFLTHPSLMSHLSRETESDAVIRGKWVREQMLCEALPPPPPTVNAVPPPPDGVLTQRERLAQHSKDASCAVCHDLIDPVGFALENFDAIGAHRTHEAKKVIDASGYIKNVAGSSRTLTFKGPVELGRALATAPETSACVARKVFRYAHGRADGAADACTVKVLADRLAADASLIDVLVAAAADDALHARRL